MKKIFKAIISLLTICILLVSCSWVDIPQNKNDSENNMDLLENSNAIDNDNKENDTNSDIEKDQTLKEDAEAGNQHIDDENKSDPNENITTENKMERIEVPDELFAYGYEMKLECLRHKLGFHGDIMTSWYGDDVFSDEQWNILFKMIKEGGEFTKDYYDKNGGKLPPKCPIPLNEIIEALGLTKEEFTEIWNTSIHYDWEQISQEQIDVLFSGDDALIEEVWCDREFAFYYNGKCYSIWDILDSDVNTLALEGVPADEVKRLLKAYCHNPNFSNYIYNFIIDNTQEGLVQKLGFTAADFAAIDEGFEWIASYHRIGLEQLSEDRKAWYNDVINKFESFEVSASLDVIGKEEAELGVIGGEEELQGGENVPTEDKTTIEGEKAELQGGEKEDIEGEGESTVTVENTEAQAPDEGTAQNIDEEAMADNQAA